MLRACVITFAESWDECLPLAEFSYNNSYQKNLKMAPFEALYGRKCRSQLNWSEPGERVTFAPDLLIEVEEKVRVIKNHLKTAQSRHKRYSDTRLMPLQFDVGSQAYLRASP